MIDKTHRLPVVRQLPLRELSRSSVYDLPQPTVIVNLVVA